MDPNEQLREHLTDAELAALHDLLDADGGSSVAGPAAAGATALAGIGTAAADPSTTDSDGDVGLPGDRTDVWADGVDVRTITNQNDYSESKVKSFGTITASETITYTLNASDGNIFTANIKVNDTYVGGYLFVDGAMTVPHDAYSAHFSVSGDVSDSGGAYAEVYFDFVDYWDGGSASDGQIDGSRHIFEFRTYDGGSTWYGKKVGQT